MGKGDGCRSIGRELEYKHTFVNVCEGSQCPQAALVFYPDMARRTKEDAQKTRDALLDAAELVFEQRGVSGASLQHVAEAAGVTRGAVYWHFRDKADLFIAMMDRAILPFEPHWRKPDADDAAAPLRRLRELLFGVLRQIAGDARLQRVLAIATQRVEYVGELDAIRERRLQASAQGLQRLEELLRLAVVAGEVAPGASPRLAARALHALVDGLIHNWMLDPQAFDLQRVGRAAVQQMLAGLGPRRAPGAGRPAKTTTPG